MVVVSVYYPLAGGKRFDQDYYLNSHVPWVRELLEPMGMREVRIHQGIAPAPGADPEFAFVADLYFDSMDDMNAALAEHGAKTQADIPNFTDCTPIIQMSNVLV